MSAPAREQIGKFRLLNTAHDAIRYTRPDRPGPDGTAVVDCPRCGRELRTRRRLTVAEANWAGSPLHSVLHDHLFHDCPATEVTR